MSPIRFDGKGDNAQHKFAHVCVCRFPEIEFDMYVHCKGDTEAI